MEEDVLQSRVHVCCVESDVLVLVCLDVGVSELGAGMCSLLLLIFP